MEKQRKFLLVLPLLVIPFLTMAFWAMGGGTGRTPVSYRKGLDTNLPQAQFRDKDQQTDKLSIYHMVQKDSSQGGVSPAFLQSVGLDKIKTAQQDSVMTSENQARQVQAKLARLNAQISQPQPQGTTIAEEEPEPSHIRQINHMMNRMKNSSSRPDPEMQQLSRMLDKIQEIQNPEAVNKKPVTTEKAKPFRAIPAIVDGKQRVADGAAVRLKLTDTATIKNQFLPKGQELFGACQITNQRLLITIQNIRLGKQIIPVNLTVFSMDGMPGIPAPEAELAGSASSGADNTLQSMQLMSMDQSIGAQAAMGGITAAKSLLGKKLKKIKVKLKDEFPILLKINR